MLPSEKLGLSGPYGWFVDQRWFGDGLLAQFATYVVLCWLVTPAGHVVWGAISQAYRVPLWRGQWRSFFPGDLFLGVGVAGFMTYAASMPDQRDRWFQQVWWQVLVFAIATVAAVTLTVLMDKPAMKLTALLSPTKLYHNGVLYIGYGSLAGLCIVGGAVGNWGAPYFWLILVPLVPFVCWAATVVIDGRKPLREQQRIQATAHPDSYWLFWMIPIPLSKWSS